MEIQRLKNQAQDELPFGEEEILEQPLDEAFSDGGDNIVSQGDLCHFCEEVLETIKSENIPATPLNFQICFEKMLQNKDENFRHSIYEILESELSGGYDKYIDLERHVRKSFRGVKKILEIVAVLYKNQILLHDILNKRSEELKKVNTNAVLSGNVIHSLLLEMNRLLNITKKQTETLKGLYQESASIINNADSNTIFDAQFGIYNSNFMNEQLKQEIDGLEQTQRNSTLLMVTIAKDIKEQIDSPEVLLMVQKNIADILLKTSRRSDIVAHIGDGIFGILLRHSDVQSSQAVCRRLFDLIKSSNIFINNARIVLEINIVVLPLKSDQTIDSIITSSRDTLLEMSDQKSAYKVIGE